MNDAILIALLLLAAGLALHSCLRLRKCHGCANRHHCHGCPGGKQEKR